MSEDLAASIGSFDYIIVGAGSAGCVLANRLSADPKNRVLLLEAGGKDDWIWFKIPVGYLYCMGNPRADWCFKTEAEAGLNGRALNYPRGKVLGGCSAINGMLYLRGQAGDYDHWRQLGNVGWSWEDVLPHFVSMEDQGRGGDDLHGSGGEWRVEDMRLSWEILDAFRDAAEEAGIPKTDDFNPGNNEGCSYFQVNQKKGWRWSSAKGFLHPVMHRKNLTVLTHAQAKKLTFNANRVTGLEFWQGEELKRAEAEGEVIPSAGAIGSPQILQLSGIGPGDLLREHGIGLRHELKGVGENLQDHLQMRMIFKVKDTVTLNQRANSLFGKAMMGLEYALFRSGPMSMAPSQLGAFARSDPSRETPNIEYHVQPLSLDKFGEPLHRFPAFTASVCNLRPDSRGTVRIKSADPREAPAIRPNYLSGQDDKRVAVDAIKLTRQICAQPALSRFAPEEYLPGAGVESEEELVKAAGDIGTTIFHPVSTCKMGQDEMAVVDERLRVRGIGGLRIADASIMPTITSGNTNSPTMMIADKAAKMIMQDRP